MLVRITLCMFEYSEDSNKWLPRDSSEGIWVNPEFVRWLKDKPGFPGFYELNIGRMEWTVSAGEALKLISAHNGESAPESAPAGSQADSPAENAPAPVTEANHLQKDIGVRVHIVSATLDHFFSRTTGGNRRMWRCKTREGTAFNVFDHADAERNTYLNFPEPFRDWFGGMNEGDTLDFSTTPVPVTIAKDGDFYKFVAVDLLLIDMLHYEPVHVFAGQSMPKPPFSASTPLKGANSPLPEPVFPDDDGLSDRVAEWIRADIDAEHDERENFTNLIKSGKFVVLDTETTGLDAGAEICQIAIIDATGEPLLNTLVKPKKPIPAQATRIHGITNAMVENAPSWFHIAERVHEILTGQNVVIYNADYDTKLLDQTAIHAGMHRRDWQASGTRFYCAMRIFAAIYGDWNDHFQEYKWQSLDRAAAYYKIKSDAASAHTAYGDCVTTLAVCQAIAAGSNATF